MKRIIIMAVLFLLMVNSSLYAAIDSMGNAVNISGKNRMLTQRMLKNYILIGMDTTYNDPSKELTADIQSFEASMVELKAYVTDKGVLNGLETIGRHWIPIKNKLQAPGNKNEVIAFEKEIYELLLEINTNTGLLAKSSGNSSNEIVNISGKQRMYSQRMAMLYMVKVWGVNDPTFKEKLSNVMEKFEKSHQTLKESSLNTDEITNLLTKVDKSLLFFQMMGRTNSGKFTPSLINRSANNILKDMDKVTSLYVSISKQNI